MEASLALFLLQPLFSPRLWAPSCPFFIHSQPLLCGRLSEPFFHQYPWLPVPTPAVHAAGKTPSVQSHLLLSSWAGLLNRRRILQLRWFCLLKTHGHYSVRPPRHHQNLLLVLFQLPSPFHFLSPCSINCPLFPHPHLQWPLFNWLRSFTSAIIQSLTCFSLPNCQRSCLQCHSLTSIHF